MIFLKLLLTFMLIIFANFELFFAAHYFCRKINFESFVIWKWKGDSRRKVDSYFSLCPTETLKIKISLQFRVSILPLKYDNINKNI